MHDLLARRRPGADSSQAIVREVLGRLAEDVRRDLVEERLDDLADPLDVVLVAVHRVGVVRRVPHDLLDVLVAVLAEQQVVAVLHRRERRRHQDRHEAVLDQVELLDDVRPQQAQRVGERREVEARVELLGDGGAHRRGGGARG